MKNERIKLCLCLLTGLFLLFGCDGYHKRQVVIDFEKTTPKSFAVVEANDLNRLFDLIEKIAEKNGMKCRPYNESEHYLGCGEGPVNLITHVTEKKTIKIEIIQFGPWEETKTFSSVAEDISDMLKTEFPEQNMQLINPVKRQ